MHRRRRAGRAARGRGDSPAGDAGRIDAAFPNRRTDSPCRHRAFAPVLSTALLALACTVAPAAQARIDYTDIWWAEGGVESGWGVNFAQTEDFIFVTFFIFGPNSAPVWYTAQLSRTVGDAFSGPVYAVTGPWFGAPVFTPVPPENVAQVGDATFTASSSVRGTLRYRIDTVTVTKTIERQSTTAVVVDDIYLGAIAGSLSGNCGASTPPTFRTTMQILVSQTVANNVRIDFSGADSRNLGQAICFMQGNATQRGKLLQVPNAIYQCSSGLKTTAVIGSIRPLDDGIEAHWGAAIGGGCIERGRLSGVRQ